MKNYRLPVIIISLALLSVNANASSEPSSRVPSAVDALLKEIHVVLDKEISKVRVEKKDAESKIRYATLAVPPCAIFTTRSILYLGRVSGAAKFGTFMTGTAALATLHFVNKHFKLQEKYTFLLSLEDNLDEWRKNKTREFLANVERKSAI